MFMEEDQSQVRSQLMTETYPTLSQNPQQEEKRAHTLNYIVASARLIIQSIWKILRDTVYEVFKIRLP